MKREVKNMKTDLALWCVHIKMKMRGLLTVKDFTCAIAAAFVLLLSSTELYAQEDRHVRMEGEQFTIGEIIEGIEQQADITILNVSPFINRSEVVRHTASPEFIRDVVNQVLAGTPHVFRSATTYSVIIVERTDSRGLQVLEQVFVDTSTGRITGIGDIFGDEALGTRAGTIDQMLVSQVMSGRTYTYHSSGTYTIITVTVDESGRQVERHVIVDMATGQVVPIERFFTPQLRAADMFDTFTFPTDYFPRFALKTNLLYGATTSMNIGAEFFLNRFLTLDVSLGWNPFVHRDNRKFAHLMVQPTLRYWIQEPFNGHFFGLSLMYSNFNVSDIRQPYNWFGVLSGLRDHRFRGDAYSASIQYGHQWVLSPRWAIEASINAGYVFLDYRKYGSGWCGLHLGNNQRHHWGLTNAGITLIYIFR